MTEPFAVIVYRRYLRGESIEELAVSLGIPADRIVTRIHAAEEYLTRRRNGRQAA
jgi:DNA-directed RNA polymerase specialized sigma24 family protein